MLKAKTHLVMAILAIVTLLAGACAESAPAPAPTEGLEDTRWILESYGEPGDMKAVLEGTEITAVFDRAEGRVHGSAGCNTYSGDYQISDSKLSIPIIAATEMGCLEPKGIMEQELQYLKALQAAESYEVQDGKLRIICGAQILIFSAQ
jgi:heat shock protein HslJ